MTMMENLKQVIDEHQEITANLNLVAESIGDRKALEVLKKAEAETIGDLSQPLSAKIEKILSSLTALEEGLKHHYDLEHETLPPIVGEVLMEALEIQHAEMLTEIESACSTLARSKAEHMTPQDRIVEEALMDALLERITREKEWHMVKEEAILDMAMVALEAREKQGVKR